MKMRKQYLRLAVFIFVFFASMIPASKVSAKAAISSTNLTLSVGQSKTLKIRGAKKKITWSSSSKNVATVTGRGQVLAVGKGTAIITARAGSQKCTCKVFVYRASSGNSTIDRKVRYIISKKIKAGMSTAEKIKAIHDYIILNCEYGYSSNPMDSHTAAGVLVYKKAVCQGYAEAFQYFMEALGIPCKTVTGTGNGSPHGWNMVNVGGRWYHIDVTWDDPLPDKKDRLMYGYFLVSDSVMAKDHAWNRSKYPGCTATSSKFITLFGSVSKTTSGAASHLNKQYKKGKSELILIVPKSIYDRNSSFLGDSLFALGEKHGKVCTGYSYCTENYGKYYIVHVVPRFL